MMEYEASEDEVNEFKQNILSSYKDKIYLSNIENHEKMLTNIFQSYIVEQNSEGEWKDFAFDFFQNSKYTYRGVDAVDSESVKSNEEQMNKVVNNLQ